MSDHKNNSQLPICTAYNLKYIKITIVAGWHDIISVVVDMGVWTDLCFILIPNIILLCYKGWIHSIQRC